MKIDWQPSRTDGNNMLIEYLWKTVHSSSHILGWYTLRHACEEDEEENELMRMLKIEDFISIYHTRDSGERWHHKYIRFFYDKGVFVILRSTRWMNLPSCVS